MNLGIARIVIAVALVTVGAVVLSLGFEPDTATPTPSGSPTPSEGPTAEPTDVVSPSPSVGPDEGPEPNTTGVTFMTLNGTSVAGLAGTAQELLEEAGYVKATDADNSPTQGVLATTVYYRTGEGEAQNKADAAYVAEEFFDGAQVGRLSPLYKDVVPASASIVVVVGEDYADSVAA